MSELFIAIFFETVFFYVTDSRKKSCGTSLLLMNVPAGYKWQLRFHISKTVNKVHIAYIYMYTIYIDILYVYNACIIVCYINVYLYITCTYIFICAKLPRAYRSSVGVWWISAKCNLCLFNPNLGTVLDVTSKTRAKLWRGTNNSLCTNICMFIQGLQYGNETLLTPKAMGVRFFFI